jgi:hypothetical protein
MTKSLIAFFAATAMIFRILPALAQDGGTDPFVEPVRHFLDARLASWTDDVDCQALSLETMAVVTIGQIRLRRVSDEDKCTYAMAFERRITAMIVTAYDETRRALPSGYAVHQVDPRPLGLSKSVCRGRNQVQCSWYLVTTELSGEKQAEVQFRVFDSQKMGVWEIEDVYVDGKSLMMTLRSGLMGAFREGGIDGAITSLASDAQ